jgi:hypothetical protein
MAIAIVLVIILALMILWQRQRLLSATREFGPKDFQSDYERPDYERPDYERPDDDADDTSRR